MRRFELLLLLLLSISVLAPAHAQYWFQFGASGGASSANNSGASVSIETVLPQTIKSGSLGFWVGEDLANGAFLQTGYLIENQTGSYPSQCTLSGCTGYETLGPSTAEWFYEYFPASFPSGYNGSGFLGGVGPAGSAGPNGSINTYGFYELAGKWYFTFNGNVIGTADLGPSSSTPPIAFGEVANTSSNSAYIKPVTFSNFSFYEYGSYRPVSTGYSYIGYGYGSETSLHNPYGVEELDGRANYFVVGSGLPQPENSTILWSIGYTLNIISNYGKIGGKVEYLAYSTPTLSAPDIVQINNDTRAVFVGWTGSGDGSYTGPLNSTTLQLYGNVTEVANWEIQYFVNVTSPYAQALGSGWYANGSTIRYSVSRSMLQLSNNTRVVFSGWSTGKSGQASSSVVTGPESVRAIWSTQYLLDVSSAYSATKGSGWYGANGIANISVSEPVVNVSNNTRYLFDGWSTGAKNASAKVLVVAPENINANYKLQYLTTLYAVDAYRKKLPPSQIYINNAPVVSTLFLNASQQYMITSVYYDNTLLPINYTIEPTAPAAMNIPTPVYNVAITTRDIFNQPVNASVSIKFKNGTMASAYTGSDGTLTFNDVPYGYINGTATYLGISQGISLNGGANATVLFFSLSNAIIIAIGVIIIAVVALVAKHRYSEEQRAAAYAQREKQGGT